MNKPKKIYKRLHKWPGLIIAFFLIYFAVSGILMNHRNIISCIDIPRKYLPETYQYKNWNLAALKGNITIGHDSILIYGNIGIWLTDSTFNNFKSFNQGFPKGIDNRKIYDLHLTSKGNLFAGSLTGLYAYNWESKIWNKLKVESESNQFVGIQSKNDSVFVISRSNFYKGIDDGINTKLSFVDIPAPSNYKKEVTLFETLWQIHSGEIFGLPGKLFVDLLGITTIFISLTGIIFFFFPGWIKKRRRSNKNTKNIIKLNKWSLKWHNNIGNWIFVFLIILFLSGMFLRPPLLIPIANVKVSPIAYTHLDQPNPWYDKLRDLHYDKNTETFILGTSEGLFSTSFNHTEPLKFKNQPPLSVMGITVLEPFKKGAYLVGSFSGLFLWHPAHPEIFDYAKGHLHKGLSTGRPVGQFATSGIIKSNSGKLFMVDYDKGVQPLWHSDKFPSMPEKIEASSPISLWNFALELHTGRIFSTFLSDFYILLVPLTGIIAILVTISGFVLYRKRKPRKNT